ncbi:cytochrome C [Rhodobacteraceae bacterium M382]|nr:cytochrome C [Rhodobacteraceae bacterium M382]
MRFGLGLISLVTLMIAPGLLAAQDFTTLKGHGGPIKGLDVARDGQVASASFDNSVGLWVGRKPVWLDGHDAAVNTVAFLDDGRLVSGGDDFAVRLWDGKTSHLLGRHKGKVMAVTVSPDQSLIATASWDGSVGLWSLTGGDPEALYPPDAGINDVVFSPDGAQIYVATTKGAVLRYDMSEPSAPFPLVRHGFGVNTLILSPSGNWLAYGAVDGGTRIVNAHSGEAIADFTLDRKPILAMAHDPQNAALAVADGHGYIMTVNTDDWKIRGDFRATRQGPVWALAFSPDGALVYAGGLDDVIYAWPVALMDQLNPAQGQDRTFLRDAAEMSNGERQFMRKCSICHALEPSNSRKAGPTLFGVLGRKAGTVPGYSYSRTLSGSKIVWDETTIDQLFHQGPDHFVPGSKMPMQVIARSRDRQDLIDYLKARTHNKEPNK